MEASVRRMKSRVRPQVSLSRRLFSPRARLIVLCAFLLIVFLTGGSSRADMQPLIVLRPTSLLVLGYGLVTLSREHVRNFWALVAIMASAVALTVLHLVPIPPALWQALPGREAIAQIDHLSGLEGLWRPLTLDPQATRNALMALGTPGAVLILGIQLDWRQRETLLTLTLGLGALTAIWALLQIMGSPTGPLYLYDVTNYGHAVGLFANRNHQAVFLASLIPLIYCWVNLAHGSWKDLSSNKAKRSGIAIGCVLLFVPLILIAGSRAGLLTLVLSVCATAALIAAVPRRRAQRWSALARFAPAMGGGAILGGLAVVTIGLGRDRAFERLLGSDPIADSRADLFPVVWRIATESFPWGTGVGSFDDVFRMYEPDTLLMPRYVNHAHNDLLEAFMTGGILGILILAVALSLFLVRAWSIAREGRKQIRTNILPAAALIALTVLFAASLVDYPLRVPAIASYLVLLALWTARQTSSKPS